MLHYDYMERYLDIIRYWMEGVDTGRADEGGL